MKEFEVYVPLSYNDGSRIDDKIIAGIGDRLLDFFQGLTYFPQRNRGYWKMGGVTFQDEIVIFRVLADKARPAKGFLRHLRDDLKKELQQEEILIIERDVGKL